MVELEERFKMNTYIKGRVAIKSIMKMLGFEKSPQVKKIGDVSVDSGTLMVIDPAYLSHWNTGEHPDLTDDGRRKAWKEGRTQLYFTNGIPAAVFIKGFGGDGRYPVTIEDRTELKGQIVGSFTVDLMNMSYPTKD
jgi:hypothetical protein